MFTNFYIKRLEDKGYKVLENTEFRKLSAIKAKYNAKIRDEATKLTIKDIRAKLSSKGVTELPKKKAELIDLYVKTFAE